MTRFRAYQLGTSGSSFSYYDGTKFTLIEGRYNDFNRQTIRRELELCGKSRIDNLHITSWDVDHCRPNELLELLQELRPARIEVPGYQPQTDFGLQSFSILGRYTEWASAMRQYVASWVAAPSHIAALPEAELWGHEDVYYEKPHDRNSSNNNSIIKLFSSLLKNL